MTLVLTLEDFVIGLGFHDCSYAPDGWRRCSKFAANGVFNIETGYTYWRCDEHKFNLFSSDIPGSESYGYAVTEYRVRKLPANRGYQS